MERAGKQTAQKAKGRKIPQKYASDFWIILVTLLLVAIGLIMVYDSSYYTAQRSSDYNNDGAFFLKKQIIGAVVGFIAMVVCAMMDYRLWRKLVGILLVVSLILMIAVWIPGIGVKANGSSRWVKIGPLPSVQSSEVARFALILYLAQLFTLRRKEMNSIPRTLAPALGIAGIFCILLFLQPNISMLMCYVGVVGIMMWMSGVKGQYLAALVLLGMAALVAAYFLTDHVAARVTAWRAPEEDALDSGYQILQSLYAIADGGWTGVGFGSSRQKFSYLPFAETDYIFSIVAEEFGFLGCIVLLGLYWLLIWRCTLVMMKCNDRFGKLLAGGITAMLTLQVLMNVAVVTNSIPSTGIPLPFISAGGSSLTICLAEVGILLNISRQSGLYARE